jgi:hypothetical protein
MGEADLQGGNSTRSAPVELVNFTIGVGTVEEYQFNEKRPTLGMWRGVYQPHHVKNCAASLKRYC